MWSCFSGTTSSGLCDAPGLNSTSTRKRAGSSTGTLPHEAWALTLGYRVLGCRVSVLHRSSKLHLPQDKPNATMAGLRRLFVMHLKSKH